jgi:RimJ/RimL family protein N-acetyltransferase
MTPQRAPVRLDPAAPPQAVITAGRLTLRPLRRADMGPVEMGAADPRVARMTRSIPHPLPPGTTDAWVTRAMSGAGGRRIWAMDASEAGLGDLVGIISLEPRGDTARVGFWVAPVAWNAGLASEALIAIVAANPLGARRLTAEVFQDNPASARVLTHAGFAYTGEAEAFSVARDAVVAQWTYELELGA